MDQETKELILATALIVCAHQTKTGMRLAETTNQLDAIKEDWEVTETRLKELMEKC